LAASSAAYSAAFFSANFFLYASYAALTAAGSIKLIIILFFQFSWSVN
jgi:hypothetical protein